MSLHSVSNKAVSHFTKRNGNRVFDISFLDVIFDLVNQLFGAFQGCGQDAGDTLGIVNRPNRRQVRRLRMKVRRELGWRDYRVHGDKVTGALLDAGRDVTREEIEEIFSEV